MTNAEAPALEITGLKFRYAGADAGAQGRGAWTVEVPGLVVGRGERVLLSAASGRGKSTLLNLIAGLIDLGSPHEAEGTIRVAGRNIHALHGAERDAFRGRTIGMVFQTFHLLRGFSALENVMAAMMFSSIAAREHEGRARALLSRLGIDGALAASEPDELSVGQQQRVAVARALACDPALVLADEPTASLDPENARAAVELLKGVCAEKGAALVVVSHDPGAGAYFERRESL
ncbi:MAG: ABC transporter ATP-binding protein [Phycisphaeraceae bacterium]|nr:ABC transporter ATP-binding protein [Phycisphaeraceae bacterium]